ncbi:DUF7005 family protein [Thiorhodovibrio frisius]|uniref:Uncharacterized protein n=1 Tax=Thiorhodovibrio frisius TaxID=631362 RepID=H8Z1L2_9GAMM|nr:hypothetical protein [Thiorhodovibrio frisius]EIC21457.1 hypothetical protein Thi970DRAFT_01667 [Thiorhodovibrio frisius]
MKQSLSDYCRGFANANAPWPALPLAEPPSMAWWRALLAETDGVSLFDRLRESLPQLCMPQRPGVSQSEEYRHAVLRGLPLHTSLGAEMPGLLAPEQLRLEIAAHFAVTLPVLRTSDREDFLFLTRALAHRCEPVPIAAGVHAQAVGGLIHWGLIRVHGRETRAQLILLHEAPYGSVPADRVPGRPSAAHWLALSGVLRLEHELTHLATKALCGEMRLNLLDELIADAMGMLRALGTFSADLFRRCLGVEEDGSAPAHARVWTYVAELEQSDALTAIQLALERAQELEALFKSSRLPTDPVQRLRWLCQQRLCSRWRD